jgi:IS30 family transposase
MGAQRRINRKLTSEVRREVIRLSARGSSYRQITRLVDISMGNITRVLKPLGGVIRLAEVEVTGRRLGRSVRAIATGLGRAASTVCREVNANGGRAAYRPMASHRRAHLAARRPKRSKLAGDAVLCARVTTGLLRLWSPEQIARDLRADFGAGSVNAVSHETIYKSLYVQGRGELRRELAACLRTGRAARRPRGRVQTRGHISGMVMISDRPAEVADRAVPGHWEGDLIVGKANRSYIATLVERTTRFVMLAKVVDKRAETVNAAVAAQIARLPEHLRRSLTWDQGTELAAHAAFSVDTGVPVYFCDPHSPWQRGSNENTNGLLRQYFPKGTDLSVHSQDHLDWVAAELNQRPRERLDGQTPAYRLAQLVATTD